MPIGQRVVEHGERVPVLLPMGGAASKLALQRHLPSLLDTLGIWFAGQLIARQPRICSASEPPLSGVTHASNGLLTFAWESGPGRTRTGPGGGCEKRDAFCSAQV